MAASAVGDTTGPPFFFETFRAFTPITAKAIPL
jgi:hypothetical protein